MITTVLSITSVTAAIFFIVSIIFLFKYYNLKSKHKIFKKKIHTLNQLCIHLQSVIVVTLSELLFIQRYFEGREFDEDGNPIDMVECLKEFQGWLDKELTDSELKHNDCMDLLLGVEEL